MSRTDVRRIVFKLAVLVAMIGALFIYHSDTRAQFGSTGCDNDYQYCVNTCMDGGGSYEVCANNSCATSFRLLAERKSANRAATTAVSAMRRGM